ncbi:MAG: nitrite reductase small subunit NirD [Acidiphilium sp.]
MDGMMIDPVFIDVAALDDIPRRGARTVATAHGPVALFRTGTDAVFALLDRCPHRGGPLSQGIVHGEGVTCPLHNWVIGFVDGAAEGEDAPCVPRFAVRVEAGRVLLDIAVRAA